MNEKTLRALVRQEIERLLRPKSRSDILVAYGVTEEAEREEARAASVARAYAERELDADAIRRAYAE